MKEAKIEKVIVHTGCKRIELTLEEVRELEKVFSDFRGSATSVSHCYYPYQVYIPYYCYPQQTNVPYYCYPYHYYHEDGSRITFYGNTHTNINGEE